MEYFSKHPLTNITIKGIFTGAEEAGCIGIYEFLKKYKSDVRDTDYFIVLDCTGIGEPVYLKSEGMLKKYHADHALFYIADYVSRNMDYNAEAINLPVGYTEMEVISNFGFRSLTIGAAPADKKAVPHWHQKTDSIVFIQAETLQKVFNFLKEIARYIDKRTKDSKTSGKR